MVDDNLGRPQPAVAPPGRTPRARRPMIVGVAAVAAAAAAAVVATVSLGGHPGPQPGAAAQAYLAAWSHHDFAAMARLVDRPPADFIVTHQRAAADLEVIGGEYRAGPVVRRRDMADAGFTADLVLDGLGPVRYPGTLHLRRQANQWLVEWSVTTIYPSLTAGGHFSRDRTWPERAQIFGPGGVVLAGSSTVVTVGLQGSAIKDPKAVTTAMVRAGLPPVAVAAAIRAAAAHPDQFVPVADLPDRRYQEVKPLIFPVDGTRFRTHAGQTTLTPDLAAHVIGTVGPITADQLKLLGAPYQSTDSVGQGGLEALYERQLAGTPGGDVKVVDAAGDAIATIATVAPKTGSPIQTSIDPHVEMAAETALNGVSAPSALVAIRASTGEVLAAVSRPLSAPFNRAFEGRYPPGSTFKIITTAALLGQGVTPDSPAMCPKALTVDGRTFHNFEGEVAPNLTLQRAFAVSCNTAFIGLASDMSPPSFGVAATELGFAVDLKVGLPSFGGLVPVPSDQVEKVATAIGQGRVQASPLQMAVVAAAVDNGRVNAPRLVVGAGAGGVGAGGGSTGGPAPPSPAVIASLRTMMAAVVTSGTGSAANLPGSPPVAGKTGTAEFGTASPPLTHAWFVGYRGDTAFAVLVEGGGVGARVAVPIAAKFLTGLP